MQGSEIENLLCIVAVNVVARWAAYQHAYDGNFWTTFHFPATKKLSQHSVLFYHVHSCFWLKPDTAAHCCANARHSATTLQPTPE